MAQNCQMNELLKVRSKKDSIVVPVYAIRDDKKGYPHFLIYTDGQWKYESAKHFEPVGT